MSPLTSSSRRMGVAGHAGDRGKMSLATFKYSDMAFMGLHLYSCPGFCKCYGGTCCDNKCGFMHCDDIAKFSLGHHSASPSIFIAQ